MGWSGIVRNPKGTSGRVTIDHVSVCGGNATSQRGGAGGEGTALPGLPHAILWHVALVVGEALLLLVPVPLVEVLVMPVEVLVPPVV